MIAVGARSRKLVYGESALLLLGFLPQELWCNLIGLPQAVCAAWYTKMLLLLFICYLLFVLKLCLATHLINPFIQSQALMDHFPYGAVAYYIERCSIICKSHYVELIYKCIHYLLLIHSICIKLCTSLMVYNTYFSFVFVCELGV